MIKISYCLFFLLLETRSTKHLPCQVLSQYSHGKFDYFNLVFRFWWPAITRFKNARVCSKELALRLSLSEVTSYSHLDKPTWLILYTACEKSVVFSRKNLHAECLQGVVWCSIVTGWLTKSWEYRFIPLLVRAASMQRGKDLSANTENISIRRDYLAYVPFILPATASLVQCM